MSTGGLNETRSAEALSWRDLERAADDAATFDRSLPLADMARLAPELASTLGAAHASGRFFRESGVPRLEFSVQADLELSCQRCLGPMHWPVRAETSIALVRDLASADRMPEGIDPFVVEGERTSVRELVEDELLLALPLVARHEDSRDCAVGDVDLEREAEPQDATGSQVEKNDPARAEPGTEPGAEPANKPFAQLSELLKRGR